MELGIAWPPTWLELDWVGSSWLEFGQAQSFAQLEPRFPPFGHLSQLKPSFFVIVRWLRGRIQTIEWFLASWLDLAIPFGHPFHQCKFWFCNLAHLARFDIDGEWMSYEEIHQIAHGLPLPGNGIGAIITLTCDQALLFPPVREGLEKKSPVPLGPGGKGGPGRRLRRTVRAVQQNCLQVLSQFLNKSLSDEKFTEARSETDLSNPILAQSGLPNSYVLFYMWDEWSEGRKHGACANLLFHCSGVHIATPRYGGVNTLLWWPRRGYLAVRLMIAHAQ